MKPLILFIVLLIASAGKADESISILFRKHWGVDSTSVQVTSELEKKLLSEFQVDRLKENERLSGRDLPANIEPIEKMTPEERGELIAIQKAFHRFTLATPLPKERIGIVESFKVFLGLKAYDCFSMSQTVFRFLKWLEGKRLLRYFSTMDQAWRGNPFVHVATPILRKSDRSTWVVDAWWDQGPPMIFSMEAFKEYTDQRLEAVKPGPKI